jgi:hypothetical protein
MPLPHLEDAVGDADGAADAPGLGRITGSAQMQRYVAWGKPDEAARWRTQLEVAKEPAKEKD